MAPPLISFFVILLYLPLRFFAGGISKDSELVEILQRFLESSTLGEFASRLQMLFTFYKEMVFEEGATCRVEGMISDVIAYVLGCGSDCESHCDLKW